MTNKLNEFIIKGHFEKAKETTLTLLALKDSLTPSELEILGILLDKSAKN